MFTLLNPQVCGKDKFYFFKGLVTGCHSFCLFFIFYNIHSITFIQYIYPSPFADASLHFLIACLLSGEKPPCGAEPRIELGPKRIELGLNYV
jgi:hypothetical protein